MTLYDELKWRGLIKDEAGDDLKDKINNALSTPNTLPSTPNISVENGFATIKLSWTYENKVYYNYEI